jgi:hypothetical protein
MQPFQEKTQYHPKTSANISAIYELYPILKTTPKNQNDL